MDETTIRDLADRLGAAGQDLVAEQVRLGWVFLGVGCGVLAFCLIAVVWCLREWRRGGPEDYVVLALGAAISAICFGVGPVLVGLAKILAPLSSALNG